MRLTVAIFANSVKHGMHCVAGKDISNGRWIRPVSNTSGAELNDTQCVYANPYGKFTVKPLQKIEMTLDAHAPLINQPENYLIDNEEWIQRYKIDDKEVPNWLDAPEILWCPSNKVSYSAIQSGEIVIESSLYLVSVNDLRLELQDNRRRAIFDYGNCSYNLPCTDPNFDQLISEPQHQSVLCISLGEPYAHDGGNNLSCYKIVATII